MANPAEALPKKGIPGEKREKTPEERRRELKVIKGGGRKGWGPGAKAGAIAGSTAAVVSGVAAALGETDNLPDSLQGFYDQAFHPGKVVEEKSTEPAKATYDVKEASEDLTKIVNETQKETPPVVEEVPEKIEWEGITFSPIEGLRFEEGTFFAKEGNPYKLEVGEKAGVLIPKDAVGIDGVMQAAFGFVPKVLEVMQKKIMEEEKKFVYAFPIDLEKATGIEIKEVADTESDEWAKSEGYFWDNNTYLEISNVPIGTIIYSPVNSKEYLIWDNNLGRNDLQESSWFQLYFSRVTPEEYKGKLIFKKERVDEVNLGVELVGVNLLPSGIEENIAINEIGGYSFLTEVKFGEPIAEMVLKNNLPRFTETNSDSLYNPDFTSIRINLSVSQLKSENKKESSKFLDLGLTGLLRIENLIVFINPVHD